MFVLNDTIAEKQKKINAVVELWGIWRKYKSRHHEEVFSLIKILIWAKRFLNKENAKMIKVVKKILEKINLIGIAMMITAQAAFADSISSTKLATGTTNLIQDVTAWIIGLGSGVTIFDGYILLASS